MCFVRLVPLTAFGFPQQGNTLGRKTRKRSERAIAGSDSGKKTKPGETGRGRNAESRPGLIHAERGERPYLFRWIGKQCRLKCTVKHKFM